MSTETQPPGAERAELVRKADELRAKLDEIERAPTICVAGLPPQDLIFRPKELIARPARKGGE